ncbi:hypothetical protein RB597_000262 [Gaeumannomyces tritici]
MAGVAEAGSYRMSGRIPIVRRNASGVEAMDVPQPDQTRPLVARESIDCTGENANLCEKPYGANSLGVPIALGVAIPIVALLGVVFWLHRRNIKKQRSEEANDPHKSLDFGLGDGSRGSKGGKRKSAFFGGGGAEKASHRNNQLSMDMNLSSPYLLPPSAQAGSRESLHSLARTLHGNEDPYSPVYQQSDARSMRSTKKGSRDDYNGPSGPGLSVPPSRKSSFPTSPTSPVTSIPPRYEASKDEVTPPPPAHSPGQANFPLNDTSPYPNDQLDAHGVSMPAVPELQEPAQAKMPSSPRFPLPPNNSHGFDFSQDQNNSQRPPPPSNLPASPRPVNSNQPTLTVNTGAAPAGPMSAPAIEESQYEPVSPQDMDGQERGRTQHRRQSSEYPPENTAALGVPRQHNKRLSVGFRPLPPDEVTEGEDPETRANRIRSFYKEYFDESRQTMGYPQGAPGQGHGAPKQQGGGNEYYEDYDQGYLGTDAAYFDPDTNTFVMPYAQPVARRAMTPPPSGSRFPGPRSGPRPHAGSVSGMSMPGNRGPHRPGSATSNNRWGPGPRPGSSASGQHGRPRAGSAMGAPRKPMPPPAALTTLPNPSKLRDDTLAINPIDFAPPTSFKDQAAGRSQSPGGGERRPYQAPLVTHSPLVSSFDEMISLPSPHLLRKSNTFTGLDFAPPRKFKNEDTTSDAGSIRSNRSGISSVQRDAIRNGAGRVSRLPGDTVFTTAQTVDTLKPQWGMRS